MGGRGKGKGKDGKGQRSGAGKWVKVPPTVLVTGAAGYLASNIVRELTTRKYRVRGTVRSLDDAEKLRPLRELFPDLELFEADLLGGSEAFERAMTGCKYVIHVASPYQPRVADPQKDLIDPSVKGTESVMQAALKVGVVRVLLTSSCACVGPPLPWFTDPTLADSEKVFTADDFYTSATLEDAAYALSKLLSEQRAQEIAKSSESLSLVTLCPAFILGPMLSSRADGSSVLLMKRMLDGTLKQRGCKGAPLSVVDVRDVCLAYVSALESNAAAGGRFLLTSQRGYSKIELAGMLRDNFKAYEVPTEGPEPAYIPKYDAGPARDLLQFKPRPVEVSMRDMARAAIRHGIVEKRHELRPATFGKVSEITPENRGIDLLVKVIALKPQDDGAKFREVVVGDSTGLVTLQLTEDQLQDVQKDCILEVRNASAKTIGGFVRLVVGKFGKVQKHDKEADLVPAINQDVLMTLLGGSLENQM